MFVFPLVFLWSFFSAIKSIYKGRTDGILVFIIFGLSVYFTAMCVTYSMGMKNIVPFLQALKELLIAGAFTVNFFVLKNRPRLHLVDHLIAAFLIYMLLYAFLPIGTHTLVERLVAFKSMAFYILVYFTGRFVDPDKIFITKYFNYTILLAIATGAVATVEYCLGTPIQLYTGYAEFNYYFFNIEPDGSLGLSTTFDSEGGYLRFASFFTSPLEHAAAAIFFLSIILAMYTSDDNKYKIANIGIAGLVASFLSIIFALSRAPFVSYFVVIYLYAIITHKKNIITLAHIAFILISIYLLYLFNRAGSNVDGIIAIIMSTIDFSNPSSVGHLVQWIEGINSIFTNPFGLGLGTSGRVGGSLGDNTGGENQFIVLGVQVGVLAIILFLWIYILLVKIALRNLKNLRGWERRLCLAVLLMKIGIFIPMLTSEVEGGSFISYFEWFMCGLMMSVIMRPRPAPVETTVNYD